MYVYFLNLNLIILYIHSSYYSNPTNIEIYYVHYYKIFYVQSIVYFLNCA